MINYTHPNALFRIHTYICGLYVRDTMSKQNYMFCIQRQYHHPAQKCILKLLTLHAHTHTHSFGHTSIDRETYDCTKHCTLHIFTYNNVHKIDGRQLRFKMPIIMARGISFNVRVINSFSIINEEYYKFIFKIICFIFEILIKRHLDKYALLVYERDG